MQKSGIVVIASGTLIVVGLILVVIGNQVILEGVSQGNGKVSSSQALTILGHFDIQDASTGVFAVQIMEFKDNMFSVRVIDPLDNEIISHVIHDATVEENFEIFETGEYKLVIESTGNEESQVFGAIGPLPDTVKRSLGFISVYVLIVGMVGLVGVGIYSIKNRRRSV